MEKLFLTNKKAKRVVVAMSGGVDSSTVAAMLSISGYEVIGITLRLYSQNNTSINKKACCAGQDIYDAKQVSDQYKFPHYVLDYESQFKKDVIDDFVNSYLRGETPVPCIKCNQTVKFHDLMKFAIELKADALVTGHYVRKKHGINGPELHKAIDNSKDQSYFLFATTKQQLQLLEFPLGEIHKTKTREFAIKLGLKIAKKNDSQDICFIAGGNYRDFVKKTSPLSNKKGKIIHIDGFELGQHNGIISYTIGQRKGLPSFKHPIYVLKIDADTSTVFVGAKALLAKQDFFIEDINILGDIFEDKIYEIRVRSSQNKILGNVVLSQDKRNAKIHLYTPWSGISPGQACVIYEDSKVLGGGWISRGNTF